MLYWQHIKGRKVWFEVAIALSQSANSLVRLNNVFRMEIPEGYEDETGFHFGPQPEEKHGDANKLIN